MSELSGNVEKFGSYLNLVFPSGALFLVCTQAELKILLLELTTNLLQTNNEVTAARVVGRNMSANRDVVWVLSKVSQSIPLVSTCKSINLQFYGWNDLTMALTF